MISFYCENSRYILHWKKQLSKCCLIFPSGTVYFSPILGGEEGLISADETEGEVKYEPGRRHAILWLSFSFFCCVKGLLRELPSLSLTGSACVWADRTIWWEDGDGWEWSAHEWTYWYSYSGVGIFRHILFVGSIPASSDAVKSEGRHMKQCWTTT